MVFGDVNLPPQKRRACVLQRLLLEALRIRRCIVKALWFSAGPFLYCAI